MVPETLLIFSLPWKVKSGSLQVSHRGDKDLAIGSTAQFPLVPTKGLPEQNAGLRREAKTQVQALWDMASSGSGQALTTPSHGWCPLARDLHPHLEVLALLSLTLPRPQAHKARPFPSLLSSSP